MNKTDPLKITQKIIKRIKKHPAGSESPQNINFRIFLSLMLKRYLDENKITDEFLPEKIKKVIGNITDPYKHVENAAISENQVNYFISETAKIPAEFFTGNTNIFRIYQYWRTETKDRIVSEESKIGKTELPFVTQLFSEDYMTTFLTDKTFDLLENTEKTYLKILDPACGSGLFLAEALKKLVNFRVKNEKTTLSEAVTSVLKKNLYGLDIDPLLVETAKLTLWFYALNLTKTSVPDDLPFPNIYCSAVNTEFEIPANLNSTLKNTINQLKNDFKNSFVTGSLTEIADEITDKKLLTLKKECKNSEISKIIETASVLKQKYDLVLTNFPFLSKNKQSENLLDFCKNTYPDSKQDLATVFLERGFKFCKPNGFIGAVMPQNWLFLHNYTELRKKLLKHKTFKSLILLGPKAFNAKLWDFNTLLIIIQNRQPEISSGISFIDASHLPDPQNKAEYILNPEIQSVIQKSLLRKKEYKILPHRQNADFPELSEYADSFQGLMFRDKARITAYFWEFPKINPPKIRYMMSTISENNIYSGRQKVIKWSEFTDSFRELGGNYKFNSSWGKKGIAVSQMNNLPAGIYDGSVFDGNIDVVIPKNDEVFEAVATYVLSDKYVENLRKTDPKLDVNTASLVKVPFDFKYWKKKSKKNKIPQPYSNDPAQWLFHGHPLKKIIPEEDGKTDMTAGFHDTSLQIATIKITGFRWPAEYDKTLEISEIQRKISEEAAKLSEKYSFPVLCLHKIPGKPDASEILHNYLTELSKKTSPEIKIPPQHIINHYLKNNFFKQHLRIFKNRPFLWHIWDGKPDGFAVIVNYHKLDFKLLKHISEDLIPEWIEHLKNINQPEKIQSALKLKREIDLILKGDVPHDIFVRWKPLEKQPAGWNPDISDGVKPNIRPFLKSADVRLKNAGILRHKVALNFEKDRGKDSPEAPWYNLASEYHMPPGTRINNHHIPLSEKSKMYRKKAKHN